MFLRMQKIKTGPNSFVDGFLVACESLLKRVGPAFCNDRKFQKKFFIFK